MIIYYTHTCAPQRTYYTDCLKIAYTQLLKNGLYEIHLIALTPVENQIVFLKPGNGGNEKNIYSIQDIQKVNGIKSQIYF